MVLEWKTIEQILKKLLKKLWLERLLKNLINVLLMSSIGIFVLVLYSHFTLIFYLKEKLFYISFILFIATLLKTIIKKPSLDEAARLGDKLGLKEKLLTYIEFNSRNDESEVFQIFRNDLEDKLQEFDLIKKYRMDIRPKKILVAFIIVVLAVGTYFIPSFSREMALEKESINKNIKKEVSKIKEEKKDIVENIKDKETKEEVSEVIKKLNKELNKTYEYDKALKEIAKAEEKLNYIKEKKHNKNLQRVSSLFKGTEIENTDLNNKLKDGIIDDSILKENNFSISKEDKKKILDNLKSNKEFSSSKEFKDKIEEELSKEDLTTKDLIKSIKNQKDEIKFASEFRNSKEKLTAKKDEKNFENGQGDKKSKDFSMGEKESSHKYGESSKNGGIQEKIKGEGNSKSEDNNAIGGSKTGNNKEVKESANNGTIGRYDKETKQGAKGNISNLKSKVNKEGKLTNKSIEEVTGEIGERQYMKNKWLEYKKQGMDYILKYEIPIDKEDIVIEYFKELNNRRN